MQVTPPPPTIEYGGVFMWQECSGFKSRGWAPAWSFSLQCSWTCRQPLMDTNITSQAAAFDFYDNKVFCVLREGYSSYVPEPLWHHITCSHTFSHTSVLPSMEEKAVFYRPIFLPGYLSIFCCFVSLAINTASFDLYWPYLFFKSSFSCIDIVVIISSQILPRALRKPGDPNASICRRMNTRKALAAITLAGIQFTVFRGLLKVLMQTKRGEIKGSTRSWMQRGTAKSEIIELPKQALRPHGNTFIRTPRLDDKSVLKMSTRISWELWKISRQVSGL